MANQVLKVILTSSAKIDSIDYSLGQLIFCQDTRTVYFDGEKRIPYQQIYTLSTDNEREIFPSPVPGFYFVEETYVLWRYDSANGWVAITTPPKQQLFFADRKSDLPEEGDSKTVYVVGLDMYRWFGQYLLMGNGSQWRELD